MIYLKTDDFFASLADMKGESDKRSEPDGGSFTNQNVREIGFLVKTLN